MEKRKKEFDEDLHVYEQQITTLNNEINSDREYHEKLIDEGRDKIRMLEDKLEEEKKFTDYLMDN